MKKPLDKILIIDFGSQYTQLIARRIRESSVYSEIQPCTTSLRKLTEFNARGIIFSGGPASVYEKRAPLIPKGIFNLGVPILGICYGMQLITHLLGGKVGKTHQREYGPAELKIDEPSKLFKGLMGQVSQNGGKKNKTTVWMSHGDRIEALPPGFSPMAHTENSPFAAMGDLRRGFFGLQFHPEVVHTPLGKDILNGFIFEVCGCQPQWTMRSFVDQSIEEIRTTVGKDKVICALSGGVDSTVVATLVHRAVGKQLTSVFINNGLLRFKEAEQVLQTYRKELNFNIRYVNAAESFLKKLKNVNDPERKRKIIGKEFIRIFEKEARSMGKVKILVQGTLYPDVIESVSFKGPSATIKTHHNVGGLPLRMRFRLIEPLRELFKDEVRKVGKELGLSQGLLWRQPFPGPGLAVRVLGPITTGRLEMLRKADQIVTKEIEKAGLTRKIWQAFAVLLPIKTVGVMGDERTYDYVIAIRAVHSTDGMTADWVRLSYDLLGLLSNRIINEVKGINRVVYDISSKPPSTIEWE